MQQESRQWEAHTLQLKSSPRSPKLEKGHTQTEQRPGTDKNKQALNKKKKNQKAQDFPGGPVLKNLPSNAGDVGLIPGKGTKIPHAVGSTKETTYHNENSVQP